MTEPYYDNSDPAQRFQPGTTVESSSVDYKFDEVATALGKVKVDTSRALKLPDESASQEIEANALQRRNKVVGFDKDGKLALLDGFTWRGDWTPNTDYFINDVVRDPDTKNLYVSPSRMTSGATFNAANWSLGVNVVDIENAKAATEAARDTTLSARDTTLAARDTTLTARDTTKDYRDQTLTARDTTLDYRNTAEEHKNSAANTWNLIRGAYYGALASDPTLDPLGNAPNAGDRYYNTTVGAEKVFNGSVWRTNDLDTYEVGTSSGEQLIPAAIDRRGIVFDTVADMQAFEGLQAGAKVRTLGYYAPGDGGGNDYEIVAASTGTDDGGSFIDLSGSGLQAAGLFGSAVSVKQFGAVGDGVQIDDEAFGIAQQRPDDVYVPPETYNITQAYSGNFVVSSEAMFVGGGKLLRKKQPMWQGPLEPAGVRRETRLLVGDTAYEYGGTREVSESAVSWLGKKDFVALNGTLQPNLGWIERNARASSYTSEGAIGFAGAARTFEMSGGSSIGLAGVGLNDNQVDKVGAWGLYLDVKRYPNTPGTTWGAEIAVCNHGEFVEESDPSSSAKTYGTIYAAGADPVINGTTNDCTLAVGISNNGARWGAGISFGSGALRVFSGEAGVEAFMKAIILRGSQRVGWETGAGQTLSYVTSKVVDPAKRVGLTFRDSTVDIDTNGGRLLRASYAAGDVAWPRIWTSSAELATVRIGVEGLGDCSLRLEASGSGFVVVNRSLKPVLDNTFSIGSSDARWNQVYAATGTINTSDEREKQQIRDLSTAERAVAVRLKSLIRAFKFNDAVAAKGESARTHFGVIAQDVKVAFEAEGLVAEDYAILCYDEWDEQEEIIQSWENEYDGNGALTRSAGSEVVQEYRPAGNRYGVRYEELLAFIISAI